MCALGLVYGGRNLSLGAGLVNEYKDLSMGVRTCVLVHCDLSMGAGACPWAQGLSMQGLVYGCRDLFMGAGTCL